MNQPTRSARRSAVELPTPRRRLDRADGAPIPQAYARQNLPLAKVGSGGPLTATFAEPEWGSGIMLTLQRRTAAFLKKACLLTSAALAMALANPPPVGAQTYQEPYRPQYHYTPAKNWLNDPNGLVDYQGEHHLFYQYNPVGTKWADTISWGHAVSTDWVHWQELPVAIPATDTVSIFSGSAVVDDKNTSGFGSRRNPPLVAIYTASYRKAGTDPNDGSVIPGGTPGPGDCLQHRPRPDLDALRQQPGDQSLKGSLH
jgi:Glycosyl hydrolases family 32 N-terminal domain